MLVVPALARSSAMEDLPEPAVAAAVATADMNEMFEFTESLRIEDDESGNSLITEKELSPLPEGVEDVLGDRGVLMRRSKPPTDLNSVLPCEQFPFVELHMSAFVGDDQFDSTRDQNYPLIVQLDIPPSGNSTVIRAWEAALPTVRAGESFILTAAPRYAYGSDGSADIGVPANSEVRYEIDILDVRASRKKPAVVVDRSEEDMSRLDQIRVEREIAAQRRQDEQELKEKEKQAKAEKAAALKAKMDAKRAGGSGKGGGKKKGKGKK